MRAMRINTKKKECVNASDRPFMMFSHCVYGYNIRNEFVYSHRYEMHRRSSASEGRFGVAEPEGCASICEGAENQYDDIGNHSTNSSTPNSSTHSLISMSYDALGRRASTTTLEGMTRHVYDDNWQVIADIDENDNVLVLYTWGDGIDNLLAVKIGGASYYPLTDIQGTIWGYVDLQNNVVARWRYDAWGNVLDEEVTVPALASIRYRFQCREWSAATGLVNFRMRWYDSGTGRWLSKDPIGLSGGQNLYAFCEGNPLFFLDPIGLESSLDAFIDAYSHASQGVVNAFTGGLFDPSRGLLYDWFNEIWNDIGQEGNDCNEDFGAGLNGGRFGVTMFSGAGFFLATSNPWIATAGMHNPHHGMGRHFEIIICWFGKKNLKIIFQGRLQNLFHIGIH